ncbi:MAG TPA: ABC transporter substrate binding protein [Rhodocyclaceae bacterium]
MHLYLRGLLILLLLSCQILRAQAATVWIAISEGSADYGAVAEEVRNSLLRADAQVDVSIRPWTEVAQGGAAQVKLIVSVGSPAFVGLAEASANGRIGRTPLLASLLPRSVFEAQRRKMTGPVTAVVLDQPAVRQMALLRYAFPNMRRVGVMLGPDSLWSQSQFDKAAADLGLQANIYTVGGDADIYPTLRRVLEENDLLLAVPDTTVYNGGTIQNVLLASYRQRVPLIGFSPAYVRAGAMLALYSTPRQIGSQTARMARSLLAETPVPALQMPAEFVVSVNVNVARSLGFRLSEDALRLQLQGREGM